MPLITYFNTTDLAGKRRGHESVRTRIYVNLRQTLWMDQFPSLKSSRLFHEYSNFHTKMHFEVKFGDKIENP